MKTKLFNILFFAFCLFVFPTANAASLVETQLSTATTVNAGEPADIKIVVSGKKIWFIADEMPVKCLCVKVKNSDDKVVLEKCLSSKTADWSLNVESLPKGEYTILVGKDKSVKFKK